MIGRRALQDGEQVEVTFSVEDLGRLQPVALVGDFNEWDPTMHVLKPDGAGSLTVVLVMPASRRYEFRYRDARGAWFNDEDADDYCDTSLGAINGVLLT